MTSARRTGDVVGHQTMMILKCPRCENRFEADPAPDESHLACPKCGARLRLRPRTSDAGSVTADVSGTLAPGLSTEDINSGSRPAVGPAGAQGEPATQKGKPKDITLPPDTVLGGFQLKRVIGRGGMATVYKAKQLSLNRSVAVKVLAARFTGNKTFVERFEREAGALAALNHPNIVNIIDKGVVDLNYYFVMEIVEGVTLDQLLHTAELGERHYTHIIGEISKALTYVHGKGIIHRDIKPSNILVAKGGSGVKVSDFGIAHIADAGQVERFGKNASLGTAHYMSPEQANAPATVDQRADVYSLAVTFYKMFTKAMPSAGTGAPPPAPSTLNRNLPRSIDAVLAKAMHPDREQRHPTVKDLCDALIQTFLPAGSISGRRSTDVPSGPQSVDMAGAFGGGLFGVSPSTSSPGSPGTRPGSLFGLPPPSGFGGLSTAGLANPDQTSSGTGGTSGGLFTGMPGLGTSADGTTTGFGLGQTVGRTTPEPPKAAEPDPTEVAAAAARRLKWVIIGGAVFTVVATLAIFGFFWWLKHSAYGGDVPVVR